MDSLPKNQPQVKTQKMVMAQDEFIPMMTVVIPKYGVLQPRESLP
jgi:hypothetical protein